MPAEHRERGNPAHRVEADVTLVGHAGIAPSRAAPTQLAGDSPPPGRRDRRIIAGQVLTPAYSAVSAD